MNWISKAAEEIEGEGWSPTDAAPLQTAEFIAKRKAIRIAELSKIILSHALVIDAEKLADRIDDMYGNVFVDNASIWNVAPKEKRVKQLIPVISDSIDLNIEWIDNDAEWGIFQLGLLELRNPEEWDWNLYVYGKQRKSGRVATKKDAIKACETALRRMITGVKE